MRINEIIVENRNCIPGWQKSEHIPLPLNKGYINLSRRLNQSCEVDEVLFVYHNKNIISMDPDNAHGWVVSVKVKNGHIIWYDYFKNSNGVNAGRFESIEAVKSLFDLLIQPYLK